MVGSPSPEFLRLQGAVVGRYSVEAELGRGGMGVVFLARDVQLDRHVAIKLLAPHLAARADMRRRFLREARIAAQCFHPHIVPIHAVEESDGLAWFVMGYVRGETLAQRIQRAGALEPDAVARIGREIGWALAYAHERGVVHRDIKPENIIIEQGSDRAMLLDFGIALADDAQHSGEVAGTAVYMAPEQALGETVDGRADLYALGATLFVAATAQHPFRATSSMALAVQHAIEPAPPVRQHNPRVPLFLADVIDRCLAKQPTARFANAGELVRALHFEAALPTYSPAAARIDSSARSGEMLIAWTTIAAVATLLLMLGESPRSLGRSIIPALGFPFTMFLGLAAALRIGEAVLQARRALRLGTPVGEVQSAIAGRPVSSGTSATSSGQSTDDNPPRGRYYAMMAAGAALAVAQGAVSDASNSLPSGLDGLVQFGMLTVPPLLMGRGLLGALRDSVASRWVRTRVMQPVARGITRMFGAAESAENSFTSANIVNAPTELMLDRAANDLFAQLPAVIRSRFDKLPLTVNALAHDATRLRRADEQLQQAERAARLAGHDSDAEELRAVRGERDQVRGRLQSTIAALENIRLDLMRAAAGALDESQLTEHLELVRDVERQLDAHAEVRKLLRADTPAGATG